jgi:Domain of unknown function (DUF1840)
VLYKFKSPVASDVIMLEPNGRRLLTILGKDPAVPGILQPQEMPSAMQALEQAAAYEAAQQQTAMDEAKAKGEPAPVFEAVSLRQRMAPMLDILKRCAAQDASITWGV